MSVILGVVQGLAEPQKKFKALFPLQGKGHDDLSSSCEVWPGKII